MSYKSRSAAYFWWAWWLIGLAGLHRLYLGKPKTGVLYLLTLGVFGLGIVYDFVAMHNLIREANVRDLPEDITYFKGGGWTS